MKKIIIWVSILALSLSGLNLVSANYYWETMESNSHDMMEMQWEYWMFTDMVRDDLSELEKTELKDLVSKQKAWMEMIKATVWKVKSWELNNYEEFAKIAPKRKAMIWKLKVFMKDPEAFEYMCMNHWDELIAKLFVDEKMVTKYKNILEKQYKSKIESIYSKKWKAFEKIIHKAYHKNIDSKNIKNISIIRAIELVIEDIKKESNILVDDRWMTLYIFTKDTENVSNCSWECEVKWPVYFNENLSDNWYSSIKREDWKMQTTLNWQPLYYFFKDEKPWDMNGEGLKNVWYTVKK